MKLSGFLYCRKHGVSFYNPQLQSGWSECFIPHELAMKEACRLLFFVITDDTRAVTSMLEVCRLLFDTLHESLYIQCGRVCSIEIKTRRMVKVYLCFCIVYMFVYPVHVVCWTRLAGCAATYRQMSNSSYSPYFYFCGL